MTDLSLHVDVTPTAKVMVVGDDVDRKIHMTLVSGQATFHIFLPAKIAHDMAEELEFELRGMR